MRILYFEGQIFLKKKDKPADPFKFVVSTVTLTPWILGDFIECVTVSFDSSVKSNLSATLAWYDCGTHIHIRIKTIGKFILLIKN